MSEKFVMRRSWLTQAIVVLPSLMLLWLLAWNGHFAGGIERYADNALTSTVLAGLIIGIATISALFLFNNVRYEIDQQGVAVFTGPFRHGIRWKAVRDIRFYRLPFSQTPFGVAVFYRQRGMVRRKILVPEHIAELHEALAVAWQRFQQEPHQ